MKLISFLLITLLFGTKIYSQDSNKVYHTDKPFVGTIDYTFINFLASNITDTKAIAKQISQFRAKEYIINNIIGDSKGKDIKFETESLASDDSGGLITIAFNCDEVDKRGLLLAFFGDNKNQNGEISKAFGFRSIPLADAQKLFNKLSDLKEKNAKYLSSDNNVNNVYIEFEDIKFVIYRDGDSLIRVFWNGFEVVWESTAFNRSGRRLNRWFE